MTDPGRLPRLLAGVRRDRRLTLAEHVATHGPLPAPAEARGLVAAVAVAGLRGRGGGAFETAAKLDAVARSRRRAVVLANGGEGEPMSRKDRLLLAAAPHLVLDGALAAAAAVGARELIVCVPVDAHDAHASLQAAIGERDDARGVRVQPVPRRYLAGEESALVRFADGGPLRPAVTPPYPSERGVGRRPTLVQNVETFAHVALIARHGGAWFRALGSPQLPGSALVTLSGAVAHPGVYEIATGTRLGDLLAAAGEPTEPLRAILLGGYFGRWHPAATAAELALDRTLGSGVVVALGASACPAAELARSTAWLAGQSAGQCGPCLHGLAALADGLARLVAGRADDGDLARIERWSGQLDGRGACSLPGGAGAYVRSGLDTFAAELADHHRYGHCTACTAAPVLRTPPAIEALAA
ncbi:MAG TPA: NADH-ubiquinone oxidoreductase-F iron-sulfur binding region domain-containing protein [Conexibacter sp.]|nr:NADH-ubiquinone oxidoreductase-F iron-sulfur binding region domain-containing protein [Conexibacter sp.]